MKLQIRKIGNSLGVIVPRALLDAWGAREGATLEANNAGIWPAGRKTHGHAELDELKRRISLEVLARHRPEEIRRRSLDNLARWKKSGAWCGAYDEWLEILERGGDEALFGAMVGTDDRGNRLRQSPPYAGMLPRDVLERLREEIAA
jgi:antitoxin component of MazEF toxin-antitoxin module